ncbi:hypothetical protein Tco_0153925 [Tanacetum coccineum]
MSTRSTSSNLFSPLRDPESLIRRRNLGELSSLFDFKEVMSIPHNNNVDRLLCGPFPPITLDPPPWVNPNEQAPRLMEELCQPSIDGRGGLIRTDKSKITRKQSKTGKHGHENQKSTKRSQRIKAEARKAKPQSKMVNKSQQFQNKTHFPFITTTKANLALFESYL